ncbi:1071_t:CDS:2, partial [Cetraspora pellucida]
YQTEWMDNNFITYHRKIFRNEAFKTLQDYYINKISTDPTSIFYKEDIFSPETLNSLDECGCIKLDEAIWGYIVNWAKLQIPRLGSKVAGWAKKDWDEFRFALEQCIPWKSVLSLGWNEFHDLLVPCEPFLPSDKFEYALKQQLKKACGSSAIISSPISIQFNGYNPLDWKFDRTTKDSFIFNFDEEKAEITRLNSFAIHKKTGYGPCFGTKDLLSFPDGDKTILWKTNDNSESLAVLDYEVFQVVEKPRRSMLGSTSHQSNGITHKKR